MPAKAVEVLERSIPPAGDQGAAPSAGEGQQGIRASAPAEQGGKPKSLEARVARMEHMLEGGTLVDMLSRLDTLQQQLQKMQGDLEVQQHDLQALRQHQRDLYLDLDRRLRKLEARQSAAAGAPPGQGGGQAAPPAAAAQGTAGAASASGASAAEAQPPNGGAQPVAGSQAAAAATAPLSPQGQQQMQADYDQAFKLLRGAQYEKAITAFEQFLKTYPQGPLSDNAQYWLGEANYVIRRFPEALKDFQEVASRYPDSPKVPDAELKAGFTHYEMEQWDEARKALTEVAKKYPDTTAAKLAENRLKRMKKEGH